MRKRRKLILCSILFLGTASCSGAAPDKPDRPSSELADSFFLSAQIAGPENLDRPSCAAQLQFEVDALGDGTVSWNDKGKGEQHGCSYDPDQDYRNEKFSLHELEVAKLKQYFGKFEWRKNYENVEDAWFAPNRRCNIQHNSLPDINLSMEKDGKVTMHNVYSYEITGDRVSNSCKLAIKNELELVQKIIDLLPVNHPFSSKLAGLKNIQSGK